MRLPYHVFLVNNEKSLRELFALENAERARCGDQIILTAPITLTAPLTVPCPVTILMGKGVSLRCGDFSLDAGSDFELRFLTKRELQAVLSAVGGNKL